MFIVVKKSEINSLNGVVSLRDMFEHSLGGDYVFHGSAVKLEPGVDMLIPHCAAHESKACLYLGDFPAALRFALVRGFGRDQRCGSDFYVFATRKYRMVIYSAGAMGTDWYNLDTNKNAYLYAVPRRILDVDFDGSCFYVHKNTPIVARATVNLDSLADAGFSFAPDCVDSTMRWWGVRNLDSVIKCNVIPNLPLVKKRKQR